MIEGRRIYKVLVASVLLGFMSVVKGADLTTGKAAINIPAQHSNIIAGMTWQDEIGHLNEHPPIRCNNVDSRFYSQCWLAFSVGKELPENAESVKLTIKTKAWTRNVGYQHDSYALIYARVFLNSTKYTNHIIHTEVWSPELGFKDRRRISYVTVEIPVRNGKVALGIGKQISGFASVDIVVYLDGYTLK